MTAGSGGDFDSVAGGPARHIPVLRDAVLDALAVRDGGTYLDGTFGAGGYTRALLSTPHTRVLALDRDPDAIAGGAALVTQAQGRLALIHARFGDLAVAARDAGFPLFDGITLDVGVSSMQIDEAARGFSFRHDGPLDMRMSQNGRSAADIVNGEEEEAIADILFHYGEERQARRIARAIVYDRETQPFTTTRALAEMIARVAPAKPTDIHPATRSFQALRIAVNDELGELARALVAAEHSLAPGGRLAIVSFHSLEDRIVKQFFAARAGRGQARSRLLPHEVAAPAPTFTLSGRQPITAGETEISANPRARSARLRVAERTDAPSLGALPAIDALARLPHRKGAR